MPSILDDFTAKISMGIAGQIEQRIFIVLNDKPKYMPDMVWAKMVKTVLSIQYHQIVIKGR